MDRKELINNFMSYLKKKGHKVIPSASLIPVNDPTVLFTTAGMHPLVPYLIGQKHPLGKRLANVQKCIRTVDIDDVGDSYHHTFFEMIGNWSLGDYFKEEAINMSFELATKVFGFEKERLAVSIFSGDKNSKKDLESEKIWKNLGIKEKRIVFLKDNWWGPAGKTGPCGPNTEMFYWKPKDISPPEEFDPEDERWIEIWNDVFMEYNKDESGKFNQLKQKNVDNGRGLERLLAVINNLEDNYLTDVWKPLVNEIEKISGKKYNENEEIKRKIRIIADHIKAAVFILGDENPTVPSNTEQGYILRRIIRRAIRYGRSIGIKENFCKKLSKSVINIYPDYPELNKNHKLIEAELDKEEDKFNETLEKGIKKFEEISKDKLISGKEAFLLFQSYGFPIEMTIELAEEKGLEVDLDEYNKEFIRHQDLSRISKGTFKSGLADDSDKVRRLHTATHLLNEALRKVLSEDIKQKGSNITPERLRFDFNFSRKLTEEEIKKLEDWVNKKIKENLPVNNYEIPLNQAISSGAQSEFGTKYPEMVSVYVIGEDNKDKWASKEICTGPHVKNTSEIGKFKIIKEESSSSGVRRIKAIVE